MKTQPRDTDKKPVNHRRILVVDDEPLNMKLFTLTLSKRGYEVVQAADGYHGFVAAHDDQPHLIVMDVRMPNLSGLEVARTLKESLHTKDIPLIIATAFLIDEAALRESKCDGYLPKPFVIKDFVRLVDSLLDGKHAATAAS